MYDYFNPRPPWGGRLSELSKQPALLHFNPRPPWGGRRPLTSRQAGQPYFNPRPPWGGRHMAFVNCIINKKFQSTPSVGRATLSESPCPSHCRNFNPRPPWGGRRYDSGALGGNYQISIHALRGEGDHIPGYRQRYYCYFNPRPPWGGRL